MKVEVAKALVPNVGGVVLLKIISVIPVQPAKHMTPMLVTLDGITTLESWLLLRNARSPIVSKPSCSVSVVKELYAKE